jgi:hypothetical protein
MKCIPLALLAVSLSASVCAEVTIVLAPNVAEIAPRIDQAESRMEKQFRRFGNSAGDLRDLGGMSRRTSVAWAGNLIADPAGYGLVTLAKALTADAVTRANKPDVRIRLTINRIRVQNHAVARLGGGSTFVGGVAELLDAQGVVTKSEKISAFATVHYGTGRSTPDGDYQFDERDENNRIGPVVARFVEKSLEELYPGENYPAPQLVTRGPGVRTVQRDF